MTDSEKIASDPQMGVMLVTVNGIDYVPMATAQKERDSADEARQMAHRLEQENLDLREHVASLRGALVRLTDQHHRTLTNSRLHDPEHIVDFRDCLCLTCKTTALLLSEPHTQPCDCAWCRFQADDAEAAEVHVPTSEPTHD